MTSRFVTRYPDLEKLGYAHQVKRVPFIADTYTLHSYPRRWFTGLPVLPNP